MYKTAYDESVLKMAPRPKCRSGQAPISAIPRAGPGTRERYARRRNRRSRAHDITVPRRVPPTRPLRQSYGSPAGRSTVSARRTSGSTVRAVDVVYGVYRGSRYGKSRRLWTLRARGVRNMRTGNVFTNSVIRTRR